MLYGDIKFFLVVSEVIKVRSQDAFAWWWSFNTERVAKLFKFVLKNQIVEFITTVGSYDVFLRTIRIEALKHITHEKMMCYPLHADVNCKATFCETSNAPSKGLIYARIKTIL